MKKLHLLIVFLITSMMAFAGEGMWIPMLLQYNEKEMQEMGMRITADDIYSINHSSLKDDIVLFGGGCTGEIVSDYGLLLTNHHCGYDWIQKHSSVEYDYLTNGFWAMDRSQELPCPGLKVTILREMRDVTAQVLDQVTEEMTEEKRQATIAENTKRLIAEVEKIADPSMVNFKRNPELITVLDEKFDDIYLNKVYGLSLSLDLIKKHKDLKIVYTPIHGTGRRLVPEILKRKGFENVYCVEEQMVVDGDFPTVKSPNPEEPAAMALAVKKAQEVNADLVLATDPDADRVGVAVKNDKGEFILLNGNQAASVFLYYLLTRWNELGKLTGKEFVVKTIVTTELLFEIANKYHVDRYDVLTGFKFIADKILELEGKKQFIGGGEESYGYLAGDFVRDKDAVIATSLLAEAMAWAAEQGKTFYELLCDIYREFGLYKEKLVSLTKKGISGTEEIKAMMAHFRTTPPTEIEGEKVVEIRDYKTSEAKNLLTGQISVINLPKSDVLQFFTESGSKISIRPSGTEPKIKFYFSMKGKLEGGIDESMKALDSKLEAAAALLIK